MMSRGEASRLIGEAYAAALSGDNGRAGEIIALLGRDSSEARMFGICAGIANPAVEALRVLFAGRVPDPAKDEQWYVLHLRPPLNQIRRGVEEQPPHVFSQRFLTAYLNADRGTQEALYRAALTVPGAHFAQCVAQLFADVAGLCALAGRYAEGRSR